MASKREQRRTRYQKNAQQVPTSPNDPNAPDLSVWQPERLTLLQGIRQASWLMRIVYLLLLLGTLALNVWAFFNLPDYLNLLTWFGASEVMVPTPFYLLLSFCLIVYLVYRDIINRSVSRRKLFIPVIFFLGNYFIIFDALATLGM